MATTIGKLSAILSLNSAQYTKGMRRATKRTARFRKSLRSTTATILKFGSAMAAAAGIGGLLFMVKQTFKNIDATAKLADVLGLTVEQLVGYRLAAKITGVEIKQLNTAFQRMEKNISDATLGLSTAKRAFKTLGIDAEKLKRVSPDEAFKQIADAIGNVPTQSDKARVALDLFGRSGLAVIKMLEQGRVGLQRFQDEAVALGATFTREQAALVEAANDAIARIQVLFAGKLNDAIIGIAPVIEVISGKFLDMGKAGVKAGNDITKSLEGVIRAGITVGHFIEDLIGLFHFLKLAVLSFSFALTFDLEAILQKKLGGTLNTWDEMIVNANKKAQDQMSATMDRLDKFLDERDKRTSRMLKFFKEVETATNKAAGALEASKKTKVDIAELERQEKIMKDLGTIWDKTRTHLEKYNIEINRLNVLLATGKFSWELYGRAVRQAREKLERSTKTDIKPSPSTSQGFLQGKASRIAFGADAVTSTVPVKGDPEHTTLLRLIANHTKHNRPIPGL